MALTIRFSDFVIQVLCRRSNMIDVFSGQLTFLERVNLQVDIKKIMDYYTYTFSHNIQKLNVVYRNEINLPLSLFNSRSLKLKKKFDFGLEDTFPYVLPPTSTWELPALTTLNLNDITLLDDMTGALLFYPSVQT